MAEGVLADHVNLFNTAELVNTAEVLMIVVCCSSLVAREQTSDEGKSRSAKVTRRKSPADRMVKNDGKDDFGAQNFTVSTTSLVIVVSEYNDKNDGKDDGIIFQWCCQNKTKQTPFFRNFGAQNFKTQNFTVFTTNLFIVVSK